MSTPSEKPTCEHNETGRHPNVATEDLIYMSPERVESLPGWCPGPVIATPKKCKIEKESGFCDPHESYECSVIASEDYHDGPFLCPICGRHLPCRHCNDVTVATEPETPVPEVADEDDEIASSFTAFVKQQFGEAFEFANGDPKCSPFYKSFAAGFLARRKPDPTLREQP